MSEKELLIWKIWDYTSGYTEQFLSQFSCEELKKEAVWREGVIETMRDEAIKQARKNMELTLELAEFKINPPLIRKQNDKEPAISKSISGSP